ncbi:MAG: 16S rRNA (cytidine(1402)-2'-O)-methyltransferase [Deltaproteobacteria bacterium]|nr:16S rRNA (cytidine(1402)-2'-O)-methyltransferase [Deltaproteobacteria bacterium]
MSGTLYIVATPIGNLEDITFRAVRILKEVDLVACEDTRHTVKLLNHLQIKKQLWSYFEHNEMTRIPQILGEIEKGKSVALVSDAGTPGISDPGFPLIREAVARGIRIVSIPGPSAVIASLSASGLPTDSFLFVGFLPQKAGRRKTLLESLKDEEATLVFYESPYRIVKTLEEALSIFSERPACLARELSKIHEEFVRGTVRELCSAVREDPPKGEMVLLIAGKR